MDFSTGGSEGGGTPPRRMDTGGSGVEFSMSDPVGSFVATARAVLLSPAAFFGGIRRSGDFVGPLVFALICSVVYGLLTGTLGLLGGLIAGGDILTVIGTFFGAIIGAPIGTIIGLFVGSAIFHLFVILLAGAGKAGFEATFRVSAYGSAILLLTWLTAIPILGIIIGLAVIVYSAYIYIMGMREVHSTTTGRAAAIVLLPYAVFIILGVLFFAAIIAVLFAAGGSA